MKTFVTVISLVISVAYATTFYPVPLKEQIRSSQVIVQGVVISHTSTKSEDFGIITEVEIKPSRYLAQADLVGGPLVVKFPGGAIGDQVVQIPGAPNLEMGEQVVLLLSEQNKSYWVNNLGMGKYSVKNIGNRKVVVNQVFPEHPEVGHMSLKRFFKLAEFVKQKEVVQVNKSRFEIESEKKSQRYLRSGGRAIASQSIVEQKESFPLSWLVITLASLGFVVRLFKSRKL